jgi:amidohydrolase
MSRLQLDVERLKQAACDRIDERTPDLIDVSRRIWETPEVAFEEHRAAGWLTELLSDAGYSVETGVGGLPTAFVGRWAGTTPGPTIGLLSEYDALPNLGHGCGHNLLAISAVGAGLGLGAVMPEVAGTVQVHGTPAEEGPSGKTLLLRAGVFDPLDAAVIFHPSDSANVLERMRTGQGIVFTFTGRHAHAAANPDLAVDALNGVLALFNNVNLQRQHFRTDVSVTGSVLDGGGRTPFPVTASARFGVRVLEGESDFVALRQRIIDCARGAALATQTTLEIEYEVVERGMNLNETLTGLAVRNAERVGVDLSQRHTMLGMSDFGNVSYRFPATHFSTATWPQGVTAHTEAAVNASCEPVAFAAAIAAAKIEAMTAIDLLTQPEAVQCAWQEFKRNAKDVIPDRPSPA